LPDFSAQLARRLASMLRGAVAKVLNNGGPVRRLLPVVELIPLRVAVE